MHAAPRTIARKTARAAASLAVAAGLVVTSLTASAQGAARIDLQPEDLARGADVRIAHIEDGDFVLGARRVHVGGGRAEVLGRSGNAWLVGTSNVAGRSKFRIVRVKANDSVLVIKHGVSIFDLTVSENGKFFVHVGRGTQKAVPVRVFSSRTGDLKTEKNFASYPTVMGMGGPDVLLSSWGPGDIGIRSWDISSGVVTRISRQPANIVDIGSDLLATYTKDPYSGGCVRLSRLSSPQTLLWRSCRERIVAFSPDGGRMATVDLLSDGIGPWEVKEREIDGTLLGDYTTGWFGQVVFESSTALLLDVNGDTLAATVRCRGTACENASDPVRVQEPRLGPALPVQRTGPVGPGAPAGRTP